jgi:hypothetical protein
MTDVPEKIRDIMDGAQACLSERAQWEERQATWYKLRHSGLKRPSAPWPGAADINWPLVDMLIEKLKPLFVQQTFANELVANFYALKKDLQDFSTAAGQWFDYKLRQDSNFEDEIVSIADYMLMGGKGIAKVRWDMLKGQVAFDSVDPMMILVPSGTVKLEDADWVVQVHQLSRAAYKRNKSYDQNLLPYIQEGNAEEEARLRDSEKIEREGITHSGQPETIIVWECHVRTDDNRIEVFSFSPGCPTKFVRQPMIKPHGAKQCAFVEFNAEIKDKGYYASRGIPERVASMQMSMSKLWNEKLDATTVFNRPIFTADSPTVNVGNVRMRPGEILPHNIRKVDMGSPPVSWDQEINTTRLTAEQLIGIPDAGLSQLQRSERRTASEVNLIGSIMTQVTDLRSRVFRLALAQAFRKAWVILTAEKKRDLSFFYQNELLNLPPAALTEYWKIEPLASADNLNSQFVYRKKVERFQLLQGNPDVNQRNLTRDLIAAGDPQDVKFLLMDNDTQSAEQSEDQAGEIARMIIGFPSQVKPTDNDAIHLSILKGFVDRRIQTGEGVPAELAGLLANHANLHFRQLQKKDPQTAEALLAELEPMIQMLGQIVGQAQAAAQAAQLEAGQNAPALPN